MWSRVCGVPIRRGDEALPRTDTVHITTEQVRLASFRCSLISPVPKASEWHALRTGLRFETRLFIGGEFVAARGGGVLEA